MSAEHIDVVFDGPPGHEAGRFVEVENAAGASINFGQWLQRPDGYWVLRIPCSGNAELDRLALVIESAVRSADPAHHEEVLAALNANRLNCLGVPNSGALGGEK